MIRATAVIVSLVATGCKVSATFHCADSTQCGAGGTCEDNTLCSFPDPDCASGASYGDYSGDLSGVCVGEEPAADADVPDARVDAMAGDPCLDWTFTPAEFDPCAIPVPTDPNGVEILAGTWTLDGDNGTLTDGTIMIGVAHVTIGDVAVVSVDHLAVATGATLRVVGSHPVAIASWSTIQIDGTIAVNSTQTSTGAGAGSTACVNEPQPGQSSGPGDGGSGGAGFGGAGGVGGAGGDGSTQGGSGGGSRQVPARIEGGCDGADNTQNDRGGAGGGAIALIAKSALTVGGVVHAGGAGGSGAAPTRAGGPGGGSGGMIKLESGAVAVAASATLAANGGQGGGGSHNGAAGAGEDGQPDGNPADSSNGEGNGSRGGRGGARNMPDGMDAPIASAGGGGGGGGVGYIVYRGHSSASLDPSATYSPTALAF